MRMLLDTHAFLWFILNEPQLSPAARTAIIDPTNDVEISPATYWEIAIKIRTGKYSLPGPYESFIAGQIRANYFDILPVEVRHTSLLTSLPFHHRDPFDRLLVAQALVEAIPIVSADADLDPYGVNRLW